MLLGDGEGSFGAKTDFATGNNPKSVAIGDLNGDGKPDLVSGDVGSNTVTVLLGNGDGSFEATTGYVASPYSVAIGDLNADGKPDLVSADVGSNAVWVLLGNGDGTFGAARGFLTGNEPYSVAIGDLNGDGKPDLVSADHGSDAVSVLMGNGDGTFGAATGFMTGDGPWSVAIGDLNGDLKADLAVANYGSGTVSVLFGNGHGAFGERIDLPAGFVTSVTIADLDGDDHPDLAAAAFGSYNTVRVFLGDGNGGFARVKSGFGTAPGPISIATGDLNGDGRPDLATANLDANTVTVLLNQSSSPLAVPQASLPKRTLLALTFPNPSLSGYVFDVDVARGDLAQIGVYDVRGRVVWTKGSFGLESGLHRFSWNGRGSRGETLPPGVYFLRVEATSGVATARIVKLQ